MHQTAPEMKRCIDECLNCYRVCLGTGMTHCLEKGGDHVAPPHFRLLMACAETCRTAAHLMLVGTEHYKTICRECARICDECAQDCERLGLSLIHI